MAHQVYQNGQYVMVDDFADDKQNNYPSTENVVADNTLTQSQVDTSDNVQSFADSKMNNYPGTTNQAPTQTLNNAPTDNNVENKPVNVPANVNSLVTLSPEEQEFREQEMRVNPYLRNMGERELEDYFAKYDRNKIASMQKVLEANTQQKEELEQRKKQNEDDIKKQKRNARITKAAALTAGLANLFITGSAKNGRNVEIPNPSKRLEDKEDELNKERDAINLSIQNNMAKYDKVGGDLADLRNNARTYMYEQKAKRDKADADARKADDLHQKEQANIAAIEALRRQRDQKTIDDAGKAKLARAEAYERIKNLRIKGAGMEIDNANKGDKNIHHIEYNNGVNDYRIPKEKWTTENISAAWSKIPEDLKAVALDALLQRVSDEQISNGEQTPNGEKIKSEYDSILGALKSKNIKTLSNNLIEQAIGSIIDEPGAEPLRAYLSNLTKQGKGGKTSLGIVHSTNNANTGGDGRITIEFKDEQKNK